MMLMPGCGILLLIFYISNGYMPSLFNQPPIFSWVPVIMEIGFALGLLLKELFYESIIKLSAKK